jgi:hypothetical protein
VAANDAAVNITNKATNVNAISIANPTFERVNVKLFHIYNYTIMDKEKSIAK